MDESSSGSTSSIIFDIIIFKENLAIVFGI